MPSPDLSLNPTPRTNWSGNYHYQTDTLLEPSTVSEVQEAVRSLRTVRSLGTRHSFNGIADSTEAQISTLKLDDVQTDRAGRWVRVGSGVTYGDLAERLDAQGLALHNMASLPHITVGGAIATGTHGSGLVNGNLATAVTELELVDGNGSLQTISQVDDPGRFAGAVVSLGALGVITHITLKVEPRFEIAQTVYENLRFSELERHLLDIMRSGHSVSLFTDWQGGCAQQVWIKRRTEGGRPESPEPQFFGATLARAKLHPVPGELPEACTEQEGVPGPWHERLPHFKMEFKPSRGAELQSEYFVPIERGFEAIRAVEHLRARITPLLLVTELRAIAGDDLWLSMQHQRASLGLHFTWKPLWDEVMEILPQIEAALAPFGARPHWGKVFTMGGEQLRSLYPRMNGFRALVTQLDTGGKFRNSFLDEVLGA